MFWNDAITIGLFWQAVGDIYTLFHKSNFKRSKLHKSWNQIKLFADFDQNFDTFKLSTIVAGEKIEETIDFLLNFPFLRSVDLKIFSFL